jgi:hypothetical protein
MIRRVLSFTFSGEFLTSDMVHRGIPPHGSGAFVPSGGAANRPAISRRRGGCFEWRSGAALR